MIIEYFQTGFIVALNVFIIIAAVLMIVWGTIAIQDLLTQLGRHEYQQDFAKWWQYGISFLIGALGLIIIITYIGYLITEY